MVSLAFHLFVVGTFIFALCSYDCSRPLLCCRQYSVKTLVIWWRVLLSFFPTLCLQVGNRLGFWGGFSCFVSFIWCQLFACLSRAAIFRLPPAFVVWSFFLYRHLWSVLSFFATGICVQSLSWPFLP